MSNESETVANKPSEQSVVLLPCPFCGGAPKIWGHDVQCKTDGCFVSEGTGYDYDEQEDAIAAWNRRSDAKSTEVLNKLRIAIKEEWSACHVAMGELEEDGDDMSNDYSELEGARNILLQVRQIIGD